MSHRPPKNDRERLQNLIDALAEPGAGDDAFDEEMGAELARRGLTLETWAAEIRAQAQAVLGRNRRARRIRALTIAAAGAAGMAAATGLGLALPSSMQGPPGNAANWGKLLDINMMVLTGGQERTREQFRDLFARAGLRLKRIVPTACPLSVVEAVRA